MTLSLKTDANDWLKFVDKDLELSFVLQRKEKWLFLVSPISVNHSNRCFDLFRNPEELTSLCSFLNRLRCEDSSLLICVHKQSNDAAGEPGLDDGPGRPTGLLWFHHPWSGPAWAGSRWPTEHQTQHHTHHDRWPGCGVGWVYQMQFIIYGPSVPQTKEVETSLEALSVLGMQ